jgi:hypothetical protein
MMAVSRSSPYDIDAERLKSGASEIATLGLDIVQPVTTSDAAVRGDIIVIGRFPEKILPCSPDGAKRNPGGATENLDSAVLHPGYS